MEMVSNYGIWRKYDQSKNFDNFKNDETGAEGIIAVTYTKGNITNSDGLPVTRDAYARINIGETIHGYLYQGRYFRPDNAASVQHDAIGEVSRRILENMGRYSTLRIRKIEEVCRDDSKEMKAKAEDLAEASGEVIEKNENHQRECKPDLGTPAQEDEVFRAWCAMSASGGSVFVGYDNQNNPIGMWSLDAKYAGSIDRMEAEIRNKFALRTNRLVPTDFVFRKYGNRTCLEIRVSKADGPVVFDHKYCFARYGNETRCLGDQQLIDYIQSYKRSI